MDEIRKLNEGSLWFLRERAKELSCLYKVEELLMDPDARLDEICNGIVQALPQGWQYADVCRAKIVLDGASYESPGFKETTWMLSASIRVSNEVAGFLSVVYIEKMPQGDKGPFLKEETKLIETIADRLGNFVSYQKMRELFKEHKSLAPGMGENGKAEWRTAMDLLRKTDRTLFLMISHKMLNHLCWSGIDEAKQLKQYYSPDNVGEEEVLSDANRPFQKMEVLSSSDFLSDETFKVASDHLSSEEILSFLQRWIQQDKLSFMVETLENLNVSFSEAAEAIRRYQRIAPEGTEIPEPTRKGVLVSLIRRFFSEQLDFINVAKNCVEIEDFFDLVQNIIFTAESHGKLGGKSAGLFLASKVLKRCCKDRNLPVNFKVPKTWYITSDVIMNFMVYNNFEEVIEQKYKEISQVRREYPNVVQTFKNAHFPPEIVQGLSMAMDDFGEVPLIVRSSSLLEDRTGTAFSGKYRSLFLANQGSKEQRMGALMDAIAEVYASIFGPDPIEYRAERGLLDFHEEMGIMIQEVVGAKAGKYFMPAYAGVAFSRNEFRWSPRIKREDGLLRLVPGLGTRAVDRLGDDYPVLLCPGQPGLRVNITPDEVIRYSPNRVDVINLERNTFETVSIAELMKECESNFPMYKQIFSEAKGDHIQPLSGLDVDFETSDLVVTFDGLMARTPFIDQMRSILKTLEEKLGTPVDIEFASDGKDFYLLQCRPQSSSDQNAPAPIPKEIPGDRTIFSAKRFVSNGRVPDITHIVYVDPEKYSELSDRAMLLAVGQAVGKLNLLLPKRQFILMGPGRWGSRGDIKLGVNVGYSDINNTAVLIEIARKSGNYVPDLSFGTHFFQDLVEAHIRYLPLYPDDPGIIFNEEFLRTSPNILSEVLPEFAYLEDTIRLIDVPCTTDGRVLQVLMNADLDEAVAILAQPKKNMAPAELRTKPVEQHSENHWTWRLRMAEFIASQLDADRLGVKEFYVFGSTKNATAGPQSDIDVLVHFQGSDQQRELLSSWLEVWSLCLGEMNYLQTGNRSDGLLDVHIVTDEDIANKDSYAIKIGAVTDAARPLPLTKRSH